MRTRDLLAAGLRGVGLHPGRKVHRLHLVRRRQRPAGTTRPTRTRSGRPGEHAMSGRAPTALLVTALLVTMTLTPGSSAAGASVAPSEVSTGPAWVSGPSPFGACPSAALDDLLPAGALESTVAANPRKRQQLVSVWTQDRFRGLVAGVSADGGHSWRRVLIPGTSRCTGGTFDYVDDVWLSFGPTGMLHLSAHVFDAPETTPSGLITARSLDGGLTWSKPVLVVAERDPDRGTYVGGAIVADPKDPARVYTVVPKIVEPDQEGEPFRGAVVFAASGDAGRTWRARQIYEPGENRLTTGHQIVVLPNGTLVDSFTLFDLTGERPTRHVAVMRSQDRGATWSPPHLVAEMRSAGVSDPQSPGDQVSSGSAALVDAAVDPASGRIYLVWQDARFSGGQADAIALSVSDDSGRHWSTPVKVNRSPTYVPIGNQQAFTASVAVAADHTVAVDYSDFRHDDPAGALWTDRWLVTCRPTPKLDCATGVGFDTEVRLTTEPFDMRHAPFLNEVGPPGFFLGDYAGLTSAGPHDFVATFSQPDPVASPRVAAVRVRDANR
ncbi:sialidase family protein [Micromonospora sp. DT231]|uniref:sialidase family protein n=1 Tax=Micromonospora sp. DT231 TaxID=3416526 RepID=UPI003CF51536